MAIDYGTKRCGIAVTDSMQIIATALDTIDTKKLNDFLATYIPKENVETIVVGKPMNLKGEATDSSKVVNDFFAYLTNKYKTIKVVFFDERFTSKMALDTMRSNGANKKDRANKSNLDKISATIILQDYLSTISNF